jgi:hypothetical protein
LTGPTECDGRDEAASGPRIPSPAVSRLHIHTHHDHPPPSDAPSAFGVRNTCQPPHPQPRFGAATPAGPHFGCPQTANLPARARAFPSPPPGWITFLADKFSGMKAAEREALIERMSIIQENPWVKDEMWAARGGGRAGRGLFWEGKGGAARVVERWGRARRSEPFTLHAEASLAHPPLCPRILRRRAEPSKPREANKPGSIQAGPSTSQTRRPPYTPLAPPQAGQHGLPGVRVQQRGQRRGRHPQRDREAGHLQRGGGGRAGGFFG